MTCMYAINAVNIQALVLTLNKYIGSSPLFIHSSCISFSLSLLMPHLHACQQHIPARLR